MRPLHQCVQAASAIEQRILGVQMQVDKISVRHADNLTPRWRDTKEQSFGLRGPDIPK